MPKTEPFEKNSEAYDQWFERNPAAYAAELEAVRQLMPINPVQCLEVGVGSGRFAVPLGIRVGVEPSASMASVARQQGVQVLPGVAEDLPFADGSFDVVLMVTTLCFVDDVDRSFSETFRVLRSGGHFLVGFVDLESDLGRQYLENREKSRFYRQATFFTTREVLAFFKTAGFVELQLRQTLIPGHGTSVANGYGRGAFVVVRGTKPV
jgi:SAM-dependent methyltransferase